MIKPSDPRQLVLDLLKRSICSVQVAAVIADSSGIFSWGWNNVGTGFGEHAECHAIRRANRSRLDNAIIYVAAQRNRNERSVTAKPCEGCVRVLQVNGLNVVYRNKEGEWIYE